MKTALEILMEAYDTTSEESFDECLYTDASECDHGRILAAMKKYAEQAIDRCAESSKINSIEEFGFDQSNTEVILKIKEELQ